MPPQTPSTPSGGVNASDLEELSFRALVDHSADMVICADARGTISYVSPAFERILGYPTEYAVGRNGFDFIARGELAYATEALATAVSRPGHAASVEVTAVHADGSPRYLEFVANNRLHDPTVKAVVITARDVTERRLADERTGVITRWMQALIANLGRGIVMVAEDGTVAFVNSTFCEMFGYDSGPDAVIGRPAVDLVPASLGLFADPRGTQRAGWTRYRDGARTDDSLLELADGRLFSVLFVPIVAEGAGSGWIWLCEDVTEREAAARVLAEQNAVLQEIDQRRAEWVGTVSHELRSPITAILGCAEILATSVDVARNGDAATVELLAMLTRNAERLRRITDDLLVLADLERGRLALAYSDVDVVEVCRNAVGGVAYHPRAEAVVLEAEPGPPVRGDAARLVQLVDNLLTNALKFNTDGGSVRVIARPDGAADSWCIEVRDTGIGIPADEIPELFGRFTRASNARSRGIPGSGLGLAIVRMIADLHDADVTVTSEVDVGTTVEVRIPCTAQRADRADWEAR